MRRYLAISAVLLGFIAGNSSAAINPPQLPAHKACFMVSLHFTGYPNNQQTDASFVVYLNGARILRKGYFKVIGSDFTRSMGPFCTPKSNKRQTISARVRYEVCGGCNVTVVIRRIG